jgi:hypothetical protein
MTPIRLVLAVGAVAFIDLAIANVLLWHAYYWLPIGWYAIVLLVLTIFEVGRYRPRVDRTVSTWRETGERFFDPTTGDAMTVYYDPATGKRDYRSAPETDTPHGTGSAQALR